MLKSPPSRGWLRLRGLNTPMQPQPALAPPAPDDSAAQRFVSLHGAMVAHGRLAEAAVQLCSDLAVAHQCERVSLGLLEGERIVLQALSGSAQTDLRRQEFDELRAAMEEAVDQDSLLALPEPPDAPPRVLAATSLLLGRGVDAVLTLPLALKGRLIGAVTLEWRDGARPATLDVPALQATLGLCAPLLALLKQNERRLPLRLWDALRATLAGGSRWRRAALAAAALVLAALLLVPLPDQVGARARVEGAVERGLSAPANGFLKAVHARPGDTVRAGQLLAELAEQELEVDRRRIEGELAQHESAYMAAIARSDRQQMGVALARVEEAKAQLELAARQLGRTRIEAPFDGVVIAGDLSRNVGAPVKRGEVLLTVTPAEGWRIVLEVDERDVAQVRPGQRGALALAALPWDELPVTVQRLTPVARVVEGRNVFEVEATLTGTQPPELRPGLLGAGRITVGRQPLAWRALRALYTEARLLWWKQGF